MYIASLANSDLDMGQLHVYAESLWHIRSYLFDLTPIAPVAHQIFAGRDLHI